MSTVSLKSLRGTKLDDHSLESIKLFAKTIRGLSMDGVQAADSGHPGLPMGMADIAALLWNRYLNHNPADPSWANRDRFVLSGGHGSMLIYSLLHLSGYDLPQDELKQFRQLHSKTPGHPEYGHTAGVETTTGPLGQGISNAVGLALGERWMATRFNRSDNALIDHFTYVIATDGDLMEGVSHEACSLAGHLKLGKLIVLYDDNHISIDGSTDLSFSEDVLKRFEAYGWHIQRADGHDYNAVNSALEAAREEKQLPSIIACKTQIGYGSPNRAGTAKAHGEPLGEEELLLSKKALGIPESPTFFVPEALENLREATLAHGADLQAQWQANFEDYREKYPQEAAEFDNMRRGELPDDWEAHLPVFSAGSKMATRAASGKVLTGIVPHIPGLLGGSADLTGSNKTRADNISALSAENYAGQYIHYGVREHGMGAIMNGLALYGGIIPFGGTFLVFSDYMRGSMRLAALMNQRVIYVFTHDSIGLGEDGPTHQPVEHLAALRAIPNLAVIRPAEGAETAQAWKVALNRRSGPSALVLTRQGLATLDQDKYGSAEGLAKGAYAVLDDSDPEVILMGSGSELHLALEAGERLVAEGRRIRVISMASSDLFDEQPASYRQALIPSGVKARVAVEAAAALGWHKYVGDSGKIIAIDGFGLSAPYEQVYKALGITAEAVYQAAKSML